MKRSELPLVVAIGMFTACAAGSGASGGRQSCTSEGTVYPSGASWECLCNTPCGCTGTCYCTSGEVSAAVVGCAEVSSQSPDAGDAQGGSFGDAAPDAFEGVRTCGSPVWTYQCATVPPDAGACVGPTADGGTAFYPIGCVAAQPGCTAATIPASPIECTCSANVAPAVFGDAQAVFVCPD